MTCSDPIVLLCFMHVRNHGLWLFWPWLMSRYIFFHSIFIAQSLQIWSLCDHGQIKQVPKADLRPGHVIHLLPCCIRKVYGWNTWANDTKNLANGKTTKRVTFPKSVYTVVQFFEGYTMFMYQMLHILDLHFICFFRQYFKSINQGNDHPSFVGAAKYSTILDTKQGAVWSSWPSANMIERCTKHA